MIEWCMGLSTFLATIGQSICEIQENQLYLSSSISQLENTDECDHRKFFKNRRIDITI